MSDFLRYVLSKHTYIDEKLHEKLVVKALENQEVNKALEWIHSFQDKMIRYFMMYQEIEEFKEEHLVLPNGEVDRYYEYSFELINYPNLIITRIIGLEEVNLNFDLNSNTISGIPSNMTSSKLDIYFNHKKDSESKEEKKSIYFMINANPRSLWKDLPSDKEGLYAKEDRIIDRGAFLDKKIISASVRGRSHAHVGSYRDDSYSFIELSNGWSLAAVADGAGSAQYSRQGAHLATTFIRDYFRNEEVLSKLNLLIDKYFEENSNRVIEEELNIPDDISSILSTSILDLFSYLQSFSEENNLLLEDIHTTLALTLCKKYDCGYLVLTYSVGDCPIVVYSEDRNTVNVLNTLDVGEFSGGTRFVTMKEIYQDSLSPRLRMYFIPSFTYLFIMSDGIYDPKFGTESNLMSIEHWNSFILDLKGDNEDGIGVDFLVDTTAEENLLQWMNFWSKGNHDDRTLLIIY
ncbi:hypothetical protein AV926_09475 [Myroides marinus]|uniref:PPM-type phosphatase domain-containing protein n=1 Tax=Myroides marinus TaxID=703342 RepID=A0A165RDH7_9FLAO|nr:PP2C family serine/threonine-protein phosphatase [Myroides marinus]KZE80992.1 hypothetical protein AV926_09475 [Myroides marinus]